VKVRLQGIAAPETWQAGGKEAKEYLEKDEGKPVKCELDGTKSHKREVGICYVDGQDIAADVIKAGLALDCPRFSHGRYKKIEQPAAANLYFPNYCRKR
jgi:micrococcal nuclease